ncbi:N-acetylglucosamine-6-phosphate deacetylase [Anaerobacillus arseniciselenatis]|uniref:N-acetylglucosamine-6-phosphate deacetylase n=1 Tax=Anaerobacillus arseniciselenatis TaxID=85682 RepID=A0A1S2LN45_9BACI|nr:N-acetylglucosamine-6-phosphate deacetylase [Anaerobacillus arseniciselenatis]OIJ12845.1 N-acetylglucosamine-6-phosphate deacetylase [Anaerobacillus arseniciselenatis]
MKEFFITNINIITETTTIPSGFLQVKNGKIARVGRMSDYPTETEVEQFKFSPRFTLIPGMIDIHIHGGNGSDVMDGTHSALANIAKSLPKEGVTSFLATTMTHRSNKIETTLKNTASYMKKQSGCEAEILGIHLEGPFISSHKAGAQPSNYILKPNVPLFKKWRNLADVTIKVVTVAPEVENGIEFIKQLNELGVIISIGHSDANYQHVERAIEAGATHVTHLYNALSGMHHRDPGVVGAALANDELFVELIVDGIHVHPEIVKLTYKAKQANQIILITDAIRATGLKDGCYELGGQSVNLIDGQPLLADGTLAGSTLTMNEAIKNMISYTGCSLQEIVVMTSENPAKRLNVFQRKGSIKEGKDADLVVLNDQKDVIMTVCRGEVTYSL